MLWQLRNKSANRIIESVYVYVHALACVLERARMAVERRGHASFSIAKFVV